MIVMAGPLQAKAVDTLYTPTYYERMSDDKLLFYYDDHYYLADKHCQFKAIEREAKYDFQAHVFDGEFSDYNNLGQVILQGNYSRGKKDGIFKAFHSNGQLKWEVMYEQDMPVGLWKYYYPDGLPFLEVEYGEDGGSILTYWDAKRRRRVEKGTGRFEATIKADGYNEFGYRYYQRKGRVVGGKPHGVWDIAYVFEDNKKRNAGFEQFVNGKFSRGYESYYDEWYIDGGRYGLIPVDPFVRAELMISKRCTIDEYSGFITYLSEHLEKNFTDFDEEIDVQEIEFTIIVAKNGEAKRIEAVKTFPQKSHANRLLIAFGNVLFWFPSFDEGEYIEDKLTVTAEVFPDLRGNKVRFFDVKIQREKGI